MGPGGLWWSNVLNSALPPQRLRPDSAPEHQDAVSHTAASVGGSPAEAGGGCASPRGQGHSGVPFYVTCYFSAFKILSLSLSFTI